MSGSTIDLMIYDEAALLNGLRRHDPDARSCLVKGYAPLVYARALRLTGDHDEAESVLQTTFMNRTYAVAAPPRPRGRFGGASPRQEPLCRGPLAPVPPRSGADCPCPVIKACEVLPIVANGGR